MLSYLKQTIGSIAERDFAHIGQDKTVADAAKIMRDITEINKGTQ
jgi:Mg/Co/Ni transporter MgtE